MCLRERVSERETEEGIESLVEFLNGRSNIRFSTISCISLDNASDWLAGRSGVQTVG